MLPSTRVLRAKSNARNHAVPRKFYTGIDVSDRGEADIVSLFHISETNS